MSQDRIFFMTRLNYETIVIDIDGMKHCCLATRNIKIYNMTSMSYNREFTPLQTMIQTWMRT